MRILLCCGLVFCLSGVFFDEELNLEVLERGSLSE